MSPKILTVDCETSPMQVWTFSLFKPFIAIDQIIEHTRMISFAAKWYGQDEVIFRSEFHHGREKMLRHLHSLITEADMVVHFNGESFDLPHFRREFKQFGLEPTAPIQSIDLYKQLKKVMYFPSYKLDYISQQLGVGAKVSHYGMRLWLDCLTEPPAEDPNRQKRAWALMRKYNKGDVTVTENLYTEVRGYLPNHPNMGLYAEDPGDGVQRCANCGSDNLRQEGHAYTAAGKYPRFQCKECGKWGRDKRAIAMSQGRGVAS